MRSAIFICLLLAAGLAADEPPSVAIHSRHVLDVRSGMQTEGYVVVRGDRIASIDKSAPKGARLIELGDATVLPGLIDCHVHLEADWSDFSATGNLRRSSAEKTLIGLQNAQTYLQRGFTTVRDAGTTDPAYDTIALRNAFARGAFPGPRVFAAGVPISVTGGHADLNALAPDVPMVKFPNIAATGLAANDLADRLLNEAGVAVLAGTAFGSMGEGYLRLSYANSLENIEEALSSIRALLEQQVAV